MPGWVVPVVVYLAVRAAGVGVLALMAAGDGGSLMDRLTAWDGQWYLGIAEHGYRGYGDSTVDIDGDPYPAAPFAFFPALPALIAIVSTLGAAPPVAALVVTTAAGLLAVPALVRLARFVDTRRSVGLLLVALTAGAPMAITLNMVYTEALFLAAATWALVGVLDRRWVLAGMSAMAAGLVRPTAVVLLAVVVAAALWRMWRHRAGWWPLVAVATAPLGLAGWWGTVVLATGQTWQRIEDRGWNTHWDWGVEAVGWVGTALTEQVHPWELLAALGTVTAVVAAAIIAGGSVAGSIAAGRTTASRAATGTGGPET
ncbi:hypothetical protein, partial [Saccharomonospora iraqiensis]|uniref:hypothetical protein n=1 Tax=Saccharomonospora iraqiensis TaxID=52698 RepID=UPI0018DE1E0D